MCSSLLITALALYGCVGDAPATTAADASADSENHDSSSEDSAGGPDTGTGSDAPTGNDGGTDTGTGDDAATGSDTGTGNDTGSDTGTGTDAGADAGSDGAVDSGCTGSVLTVKNYDSWCSVSVAGGPASSASLQTLCVNTAADLAATAASAAFQLGTAPWHHTTGDTGSGELGTVTGSGASAKSSTSAAIIAGAPKCVWVCCEFAGGGGCPTIDQCP